MPVTNVASLVDMLRETGVLSPSQLTTAAELESQCGDDAQAAANVMVERQWLTQFQRQQLFTSEPRQNLVVGPYVLLEILGEGGMGQVFKARHSMMRRIVALKLIHANQLGRESEAVQRFEREARAAAVLSHPHIVMTYDAGCAGSAYYIAMEYIDGADLSRVVREGGPLPVIQALDYVRQAALGLQHAHEHGMVHRDIKPSNLLLTRATNLVKILDMGLARFDQTEPATSLTRDGVIIGTPDFIAPEQARNAKKVDIRSDLYSLGATLYFLLTGEPPFPEGSAIEKLLKHQLDPAPLLHEVKPGVPQAVSLLVQKQLSKSPAERCQTPAELAEMLAQLQARFTPPQINVAEPPVASTPRIDASPTPMPASTQETVDLYDSTPAEPAPPPVPAPPAAITPAPVPPPVPAPPAPAESAEPEETVAPGISQHEATRLARLTGHLGAVSALAFSDSRDLLASGGMDGSVRLWDFTQGPRERSVIRKHAGAVSALAFTSDDSVLAAGSASSDGLIWIGDLAGPDPLDLAVLKGHAAAVTALAFSPAAPLLASASQDLTVRIWEMGARPRCRAILKGHAGPIRALAFAPDGLRLASASPDGTVRLWDVERGRNLATLPHRGGAWTVCFSPDGELLVAAGGDRVVRIWDQTAGDSLHEDSELTDHDGPIRRVLVSEDNDRLVAVGEGCQATVWFQGHDTIERWELPMLTYATFALTGDGRYLANGGIDGAIHVFRISRKRGR